MCRFKITTRRGRLRWTKGSETVAQIVRCSRSRRSRQAHAKLWKKNAWSRMPAAVTISIALSMNACIRRLWRSSSARFVRTVAAHSNHTTLSARSAMPALRIWSKIGVSWASSRESSSLLCAVNLRLSHSCPPCPSAPTLSLRMLSLLISAQVTPVSVSTTEACKSEKWSTKGCAMLAASRAARRSMGWLSSHRSIIRKCNMSNKDVTPQRKNSSLIMANAEMKSSSNRELSRRSKKNTSSTLSHRSLESRPKWCVIVLRWSLNSRVVGAILVEKVVLNLRACTKMLCAEMMFRRIFTAKWSTQTAPSHQIVARQKI